MTAPAFSPEIVAGATAGAKIHKRYRIRTSIHGHEVEDCLTDEYVFRGSDVECQEWIDCQAFSAALQALLPITGDVIEAMVDVVNNQHDGGTYSNQFAAAINHIIGQAP